MSVIIKKNLVGDASRNHYGWNVRGVNHCIVCSAAVLRCTEYKLTDAEWYVG